MSEQEQKAYDLKILLDKLKGRGLDLAEDAAMIVIDEVSKWVVESAALSETPFDDVLAVVMPTLKKEIEKIADGIDGKDEIE